MHAKLQLQLQLLGLASVSQVWLQGPLVSLQLGPCATESTETA